MIWKVKLVVLPTNDLAKEINKVCKEGWEPFSVLDRENHYTEVYFKKQKASK